MPRETGVGCIRQSLAYGIVLVGYSKLFDQRRRLVVHGLTVPRYLFGELEDGWVGALGQRLLRCGDVDLPDGVGDVAHLCVGQKYILGAGGAGHAQSEKSDQYRIPDHLDLL